MTLGMALLLALVPAAVLAFVLAGVLAAFWTKPGVFWNAVSVAFLVVYGLLVGLLLAWDWSSAKYLR